MKKNELASHLARKQNITQAQAADQLDSLVHSILRRFRKGEPASLPGVGLLRPPEVPSVGQGSPKSPAKGKTAIPRRKG